MSTLRTIAFSAFILSALAACSSPSIPEQIAAAPDSAQHTDWLHSQAPLLPSNIDAGN